MCKVFFVGSGRPRVRRGQFKFKLVVVRHIYKEKETEEGKEVLGFLSFHFYHFASPTFLLKEHVREVKNIVVWLFRDVINYPAVIKCVIFVMCT